MTQSIKQAALNFEADTMNHIVDLDKVSVNLALFEQEKTSSKGEKYNQFYTVINNKKYLIPGKVLEFLQEKLELKPDIEFFKVTRTGSGLATKYKVEII